MKGVLGTSLARLNFRSDDISYIFVLNLYLPLLRYDRNRNYRQKTFVKVCKTKGLGLGLGLVFKKFQ